MSTPSTQKRKLDALTTKKTNLSAKAERSIFRPRELERRKHIAENLNTFYAEEKNFDILFSVLSKQAKISLRALEFCASNEILWRGDPAKVGTYQDSLDAHSKLLFDSFRRHEKFQYTDGNGRSVTTNLAQLSFLKFSIEEGVIKYLMDKKNLKAIELEMKREGGVKKKRRRKKKLCRPVGRSNIELVL